MPIRFVGASPQNAEIVNAEQDLETKLDCSLYVERYLDALEQIASLNYKKLLRRNVADYFENHFRYGIHLWQWYKKNVEKMPEELFDIEFSRGLEEIPLNESLEDKVIREKNESERWYYFRWWCNLEENV